MGSVARKHQKSKVLFRSSLVDDASHCLAQCSQTRAMVSRVVISRACAKLPRSTRSDQALLLFFEAFYVRTTHTFYHRCLNTYSFTLASSPPGISTPVGWEVPMTSRDRGFWIKTCVYLAITFLLRSNLSTATPQSFRETGFPGVQEAYCMRIASNPRNI